MSNFAANLRVIMGRVGWSQTDLAEATGIGKSSISQYLSGHNTPSKSRRLTLADALGVPPEAFDQPPEIKPRTITVQQAARCMCKGDQFVREGIKRGALPFGVAVPGTGGKYSYYISPGKFKEFVGEEAYRDFFGGAE